MAPLHTDIRTDFRRDIKWRYTLYQRPLSLVLQFWPRPVAGAAYQQCRSLPAAHNSIHKPYSDFMVIALRHDLRPLFIAGNYFARCIGPAMLVA